MKAETSAAYARVMTRRAGELSEAVSGFVAQVRFF